MLASLGVARKKMPCGMCHTTIPKGAPSPDKEYYRPISITPIVSKVYEKLLSHKLSNVCSKYGFLPAAQFAYRNGLGH